MCLNWASALPSAAPGGAAPAWASDSRPMASTQTARRAILGVMFTQAPWQGGRVPGRTPRRMTGCRIRPSPFSVPRWRALEHAVFSAQVDLVDADRAQISRQPTLGDLGKYLAGGCTDIDAIGAEIAEILAQPAPRPQRPLAAPERQAQRFDFARAGLAGLVAIVQPKHLVADDRGMQLVDQDREILAMLVAPDRGEDARGSRPFAQFRRQHRLDLQQCRPRAFGQPGAGEGTHETRTDHQRLEFVGIEHQRRDVRALAQHVADAGLALDRHA